MSAPVELEYKTVAVAEPAAPPDQGIVEALVAVTGVRDDVGDIIVPGAFTKTLASRKPKVCLGHDWNRPIGKTLDIKELMPGDPALPKTTAEGKPWPKEAGAVWARYQANLHSDDGKSAFQSAKFFGTEESTYSIGYKTTSAKHKGNTRYIHELDLFEFGPVLHPANRLATLQSIKSGEPQDIEYTDFDAADEEKGVMVEDLTLRDYAAILDLMEEKVAKVRRVADSAYWGLPVGTIIKPGMKPQGTGKGGTTNRGLTARKPADAPKPPTIKVGEHVVSRDGYAAKVVAIDGDKVTVFKAGESKKTFNRSDVSRGVATLENPITLKPTASAAEAADYVFREPWGEPEEVGASYENGMLIITDLGRAIDTVDNELDIMEDNPDRKKSAGASARALRKKLVSLVDFDDEDDAPQAEEATPKKPAPKADAAPANTPAEPDKAPKPNAPTEDLAKIQEVGKELGMEVRAAPWPPQYIVEEPKGTRGYGGGVISFSSDTGRATTSNGIKIPDGRVEEYMRTWLQERDKDKGGYAPSSEWVLSQMDRPAREAAAKQESDRKKREAVANATNEQLQGQAQFEVDRLVRLEALRAEMRASGKQVDEAGGERARARGLANLDIVNAELTKRGLPTHHVPTYTGHPALEEFGPEVPGPSDKPTGGRPISEILDSMPINPQTQNVRYRIAHGEDVLDDPTGSGVFAVGNSNSKTDKWTVTVGSGDSLPTGQLLATATNDKTAMPNTSKKMTAWLTALGSLRDANGNPPQYGAPDSATTLGFTDAEGRTLAKAIQEVAVPAYLAAIGKNDGIKDRSTVSQWKRDVATAMQRMPFEMRKEVQDLNVNGRQAYYQRRSQGQGHATALQGVRDMIANARSVSAAPTVSSRPASADARTLSDADLATEQEEVRRTLLSMGNVSSSAQRQPWEDRSRALETERSRRAAVASTEQDERTRRDRVAATAETLSRINFGFRAAKARELAGPDASPAELLKWGHNQAGFAAAPDNRDISLTFMRWGKEIESNRVTVAELAERVREYDLREDEAALFAQRARNYADVIEQSGADSEEARRVITSMRELADRVSPSPSPSAPSVSLEDGRVMSPAAIGAGEERAFELTSGNLTLRVYKLRRPTEPGKPWAYDIVNTATGETIEGEGLYGSPGSALVRAESEFQQAERQQNGGGAGLVGSVNGTARTWRALSNEDLVTAFARARAMAGGDAGVDAMLARRQLTELMTEMQTRRDAGQQLPPIPANVPVTINEQEEERRYQAAVARAAAAETAAPSAVAEPRREQQDTTRLLPEDQLEMDRLKAEGRDNEVAKYWREANARARAAAGQAPRSAGPTRAALAEMQRYRAMSDVELEASLSAARLRAQTDASARNEIMAIRRELDARESARRDVPRAPDAPAPQPEPAPVATIAPELLDEAVESEAASVGLSETPDGALEVEPEVADRQDRVEKLIKDADAGKLNLAEKSTDELTDTRRDLVDELRLQTAMRRRTPTTRATPRPSRPAEAPKTRPGLAGAAEDHAEALRSGDEAAIARTRTRLESSIRRSRTDSEIARSLADTVTSRDDSDADQLSDLAKRLRAESRERRNASARKRRTAKRIERERLQSLLGAVDTELRGRGVELEQVPPELLAPGTDSPRRPTLTDKQKAVLLTADQDGWVVGHGGTVYSLISHNLATGYSSDAPASVRARGSSWARLNAEGMAEVQLLRSGDANASMPAVSLPPDQQIEQNVYTVYKELAQEPGDWIRIARIAKRIGPQAAAELPRVLTAALMRDDGVQLAPESNTKVLTAEDRAAAIRAGGEDLHLISFEDGFYVPPASKASNRT